MGLFQQLNRLGILSVGRRPEWQTQTAHSGAPSGPGAGVALSGAVKTLVHIAPREESHRRTLRVSIAYDGSTTYEVTIDGSQVDTEADTDEETTLAAMADDINADENAGSVVSATVQDGQLVLLGQAEADYSVEVDVSGDGEIEVVGDATAASARVWLLPGGTGDVPGQWTLANDGEFGADYRGITERLSTAGYARIYVEAFDADGEVSVAVGPGVME